MDNINKSKIFQNIKDKIIDLDEFVFLTGAGISQESGIPTFRGTEGLWRKYDPMKLASIAGFYENPKLVWEFYKDRQELILIFYLYKNKKYFFAISKPPFHF